MERFFDFFLKEVEKRVLFFEEFCLWYWNILYNIKYKLIETK